MSRKAPDSIWRLLPAAPPLVGAAALLNICWMGPVSLATLGSAWASGFFVFLVAVTAWWTGYWWLLRKLSVPTSSKQPYFAAPLVLLSLSLLPDLAVMLSGRLPYTLLFDEDLFRQFRYIAGAILAATVVAQELLLLGAAEGKGLPVLVREAGAAPLRWAAQIAGRTRSAIHRPWAWSILALILVLVLGAKLRLDALELYHGGDMDVILSITYNILAWPPVTYYRNYMAQTWVYNHLPLFPIVLAPIYWLFENVLNLSTVWAAKLVIGVADAVVAVVLYRGAAGRWKQAWGLLLAGVWMLAPWVVDGDDHPIAVSIAFALLALANVERAWLAGILLALGMSTRNEVAFLVLPVALHLLSTRGFRQATAFALVFGSTLSAVALPFFLYDPGAMDYALRRQLQRDASDLMSMVSALAIPRLPDTLATFIQQNPSVLALGMNVLVSLVALRDRRMDRVALLALLGYLLTLPLVYDRYFLATYALGLYYAGRHLNPFVGMLVLAIAWPGTGLGSYAMLALFGLLILSALLPGTRERETTSMGSCVP